MARLGFELHETADTDFAIWRHGRFELCLPADRKFAKDSEAVAVIIDTALSTGSQEVRDKLLSLLGIKERLRHH